MSLTAVRGYFRDLAEADGFEEHPDGFNVENVPAVSIDRAFHILNLTTTGTVINHRSITFETPIQVRLFFRGFSNPSEAIDEAIDAGEDYICSVLSTSNRLGASVKNVTFVGMTPEPFDATNDNDVILLLEFSARTIEEI